MSLRHCTFPWLESPRQEPSATSRRTPACRDWEIVAGDRAVAGSASLAEDRLAEAGVGADERPT